MSKFKITDTHTGHVYVVEGSDPADAKQKYLSGLGIDAAGRMEQGFTTPPQDSTAPQNSAAMAPAVQQAATAKNEEMYPHLRGAVTEALASAIPFGDEVISGIGGALSWAEGKGFDPGYNATLQDFRSTQKNYEQQHPIESTAVGIGGTAAGLVGGYGAVKAAGSGLRAAGVLAPRAAVLPAARTAQEAITHGARVGLGYGAVSGYGAGEGGVENRLRSGGVGALTGALSGAAFEPVGNAIANKITTRAAQKLVPTAAQNVATAGRALERAKASGVQIRPSALQPLAKIGLKTRAASPEIDISPKNYPQSREALRIINNQLTEPGMFFDRLTATRRSLVTARKEAFGVKGNPDDARITANIVREWDAWAERLDPNKHMYPGNVSPQEAMAIWKEGRQGYHQGMKGTVLADAVKAAQDAADANDNIAFEDRLRTEFKKIVTGPDFGMFTKHEQNQIRQTMKGGDITWVTRQLARVAPSPTFGGVVGHGGAGAGLGGMVGGGLGFLVGAPYEGAAIGAATLPALGYIAKKGVRRATKAAQEMSEALVNSGGNLPYVPRGPYSSGVFGAGQGAAEQVRGGIVPPPVDLPGFTPYPQRPPGA